MASIVYNSFCTDLGKALTDLQEAGADVRVLLATTSYTPDKDHVFVSSITNEVSGGTGYSRKALSSQTLTVDNTNDWAIFDAADLVYTAANFGTFRYIILYIETASSPTDANRRLIECLDITSATTNGTDMTLVWNASGLLTIASA